MSHDSLAIIDGDLDHPAVQALLAIHLANARSISPACSVHALDDTGLRIPQISFYSAWQDDSLIGFGAIKDLGERHGEVKSMHVAAAHRGKGMAGVILNHLIEQARLKAMTRLSLETGSQDGFAPARALYARHGFAFCEPFADYRLDPSSVFMTREI
ncbi:MAG: GNAT family N-acetyltransferase [Micavibrio sp. TMED2]|nr:GNAT family N-acetyltransferase [Alphaproteobacteria bacterium]MAS48566.1 GNAT family N-acetyltransferase [Alphaproteobacteria bacterium]MAX96176.1 GNAT family N-acetyltransferase [Alphaproteobacteria bacterium]OUT39216.1 MAG: GNAT family N-acetyltransferase [Micavibrio sp. TMED2]|tara:strand:- start:5907 stop:6377 length:471 start_codon:yes stop_codon:yes gene_type:complete